MLNNIKLTLQFMPGTSNGQADALCRLQFSRFRDGQGCNATPWFPITTLQQHARELTALAYRESTYKSYSRAWQLFLNFMAGYQYPVFDMQESQFMEFIAYLSLSSLAPSTILLYISGVRANLCWHKLTPFYDSFVIKMRLKGLNAKHRDPDVRLPVTRDILGQMCQVLPCLVKDPYTTCMYASMLTLAYNGLLRPGEFTYSPHVIRVENVWFHNGNVVLYFPSSKTHQYPNTQSVTVQPHPNNCPVCQLMEYLKLRLVVKGPLYLTSEGIPVQYKTVLKLFQSLTTFLDLPVDRYKPHSLRIGATTKLHVHGYSNKVIQERGR